MTIINVDNIIYIWYYANLLLRFLLVQYRNFRYSFSYGGGGGG